jgi:hypothetical protein
MKCFYITCGYAKRHYEWCFGLCSYEVSLEVLFCLVSFGQLSWRHSAVKERVAGTIMIAMP